MIVTTADADNKPSKEIIGCLLRRSTEDGFQRTDTAQLGENPAFVTGLMSNFSEDPQKAKLYHQVEAK